MENVMDKLVDFATVYGIRVIGAILILIIGRIVASIFRRVVQRILERYNTEPSIVSFAGSLTYVLIIGCVPHNLL